MRTPAQASGRYDFVTDVPIQGPTDEGMRAASCWWTQNVLPVKNPACTDCNGPIPRWANKPTSWGGGWPQYGGNGGSNCSPSGEVHYGSRRVAGFSLDGSSGVPRDVPRGWSVAGWQDGGSLAADVVRRGWSVAEYRDGGSLAATGDSAATLSSDQQAWVQSTLNTLNQRITSTTGTSCPAWQDAGTSLAAAVGCFQLWANANGKATLRSDGVLDADTLSALQAVTAAHAADFQTPYPAAAPTVPPPPPVASAAPRAPMGPPVPPIPPPPPVTAATVPPPPSSSMEKVKKYGPMVALGVASAIVVGGVVYTAATSKGRNRTP